MLTARDRLGDRISGLDSGADDYLVKPFAPEELSARLRAVSRRSGAGAARSRSRFGSIEVDLAARAAFVSGERADLTAREWALLEALVLRAGRIVPKADLEKLVHGFDSEVASNALEVHVSALRRKLGRDLIETVRGWATASTRRRRHERAIDPHAPGQLALAVGLDVGPGRGRRGRLCGAGRSG
jgi:two-component system OmpR family response regulator